MKTELQEQFWNQYKDSVIGTGLYPHRISCPAGYLDPKYYALINFVRFTIETPIHESQEINGALKVIASSLYKEKNPTYFVKSELLSSIASTEPPTFKVSDIKLIRPAFTLVFPLEFIKEYTDHYIPYAMVTRFKDAHNLLIGYYVVYDNLRPYAEFISSLPRDRDTSELSYITANYIDVTDKENEYYNRDPNDRREFDDKDLSFKMSSLIVKLLLVLMTRPSLATEGLPFGKKINKHTNSNHPWNPNFIGLNYKISRPIGYSHASPRLHWRRGHLRNQAYGKDFSQHKLIWIESVLVGEESHV